jgi:hypothetical protein
LKLLNSGRGSGVNVFFLFAGFVLFYIGFGYYNTGFRLLLHDYFVIFIEVFLFFVDYGLNFSRVDGWSTQRLGFA